MKLHYRINLTSLGILLLVSLAIVVAGATAITRIAYDLNRKLMFKELNILQAEIQSTVNILEQSGVAGVESYRLTAQRDLVDQFNNRYNNEEEGAALIILLREEGRSLLNPPQTDEDQAVLDQLVQSGTGTLSSSYNGKQRYFAFTGDENWGWQLILYEDNEKLLEMRRTFLQGVLVIMVFSLALGAAYLFWSTNRIVRPIHQLAETAGEISKGNWTATLPDIEGSDEISHLTQSFREMSKNLSSTYKDLNDNLVKIQNSQEELATEKERLAVTLRSIGDGVICTDQRGRITLLNKVAEELTSWSQESALGEPFYKVFSVTDVPGNVEDNYLDIIARFQTGSSEGLDKQSRLVSKEQAERIISTSGAPIFDAKGSALGAILVFRDISESVKLQEELIKAYKLESVGILAGGIAHDFNNLLTGILGNISLAKMIAGANDDLQKKLDTAEKASLRAKDLTTQLLTFSKGGEPVRKLISLDRVVEESALFAMAGSNCTCELDIDDELSSVEADEGQISQVIHNLIINGSQAMPDGGTIKVVAENLSLQKGKGGVLQPGNYIRISVNDNGCGIDRESLGKIFDPYYTTKQGGSGLGLASAYSIVKKHGGFLEAESEVGSGSNFSIYLPVSELMAKPSSSERGALISGSGAVLVVDDDELVKEVTGKMLDSLGFSVEYVEDGEAAIKRYVEKTGKGERYEFVVMDLTIPGGMGGKETIEKLKDLDPGVRAIVSSGYANDPIMAHFREYGFSAVLPKPFNIEDLSRTLNTMFSEKN